MIDKREVGRETCILCVNKRERDSAAFSLHALRIERRLGEGECIYACVSE